MWRSCWTIAVLVLGCGLPLPTQSAEPPSKSTPKAAKSRTFLFTYATSIRDVPAGSAVRVWLPVPPSNRDQDVTIVAKELPAEGRMGKETKYGNTILYVEAKAPQGKPLNLSVTYRVTRREVRGGDGKGSETPEKLAKYLEPSARVPIGGKPLELLRGKTVPRDHLAEAELFYVVVNGHMRYSKEGIGWGRGDAVWACESGFGNCSDFHSLFMSLCRSYGIPTKFEIGFPLPEKRGAGEIAGYHCWAKFWVADKGWVPVDISEANKNPKLKGYYFGNLTEDRVAFSTGRDFHLVPRQDGGPVNFFVYPYVEVAGKPLATEKIQRQFRFEDVKVIHR
jgi:transglutaminase-like putative cysteine protease